MVKLEWWKTASNDLTQIYNYIYEDSIFYAMKTVNKIVDLTQRIIIFPYMGRKVPEYSQEEIRELIYKSYRIIYEIQSDMIYILRIWHSARKLPSKLIS